MDGIQETTPGLGHNAPPSPIEVLRDKLAEYHKPLLRRRDDLLASAERAPKAVENDDTAGRMTDFIKQLTGAEKASEAARVAEKEPHLEASRAVDGWFKQIGDPLKKVRLEIQGRLEKFLIAKAQAEQRKRDEEAKRAREEAERQAAAAATSADLDQAIAQEAQAAKIEAKAEEKPAEMARTRGDYGGVGTLRTTWEFEIVDPTQIPRSYMTVNEQAIRAAIRAGTREIPGVRVYEKQTAMVR